MCEWNLLIDASCFLIEKLVGFLGHAHDVIRRDVVDRCPDPGLCVAPLLPAIAHMLVRQQPEQLPAPFLFEGAHASSSLMEKLVRGNALHVIRRDVIFISRYDLVERCPDPGL